MLIKYHFLEKLKKTIKYLSISLSCLIFKDNDLFFLYKILKKVKIYLFFFKIYSIYGKDFD